jgi:DNA-binding MarR family transcriptional regulator
MTDLPTDDARARELYDLAVRIGLAWREMRRGSSAAGLRDWLYGTGDDGIEQGQMDSLDQLASRPSWRMSELADALRVDPSSATRAIQRLEKAGLAERRPSTEDGRVVEVAITEEGRRRHLIVAERRSEMMTFILGQYRTRELPVVADVLERFVAAIDDFVVTRDSADSTDPTP